MKKTKLFAWDFHGTLEEGIEVGFFEIVKQLSKEYKTSTDITLKKVRKLYGVTVFDYLKHFFPKSSTNEIKEMMSKVAKIQNQEHLKKFVVAAPNALEVLTKIKKAGHINIIVSNSHPRHINPLIDIVAMRPFIEEVIAVDRHYTNRKFDVVTEKVKSIKIYAKRSKISDIIAVGDRPHDIEAGNKAGAITYQYIRKGFPLFKTDADYKISDLREVLREI